MRERLPSRSRIDPPEVVLGAVDERHRHLVGEPADEVVVAGDVDRRPRVAGAGAHLGHDLLGHLAQVALRTRVEHDARRVGVRRAVTSSGLEAEVVAARQRTQPSLGDLAGGRVRQAGDDHDA